MIRGFEPRRHERFFTGDDKAFIGEPFDWSGVGNTAANGTGQWATMVSPIHFLTSNHNPPTGSTLTFFTGNTPSESDRRDFSIVSNSLQRIGDTDLMIGTLSAQVNEQGIAFYPVIGPPPPGASQLGEMEIALLGREIFMYGRAHRVGRNTIEGFATVGDPLSPFPNPVAGAAGRSLVSFFNDPDFDSEARAEGGDSGGATFLVQEGSLALAGLHWFKFEGELAGQNISGTGDASIAHSINAINAAMSGSGFGLTVIAVPEPSALVLALVGGSALLWVRQRRRSDRSASMAA